MYSFTVTMGMCVFDWLSLVSSMVMMQEKDNLEEILTIYAIENVLGNFVIRPLFFDVYSVF